MIPEGGWRRLGTSLWVRPPGCEPVRLCLVTRAMRQDPGGPTVQGPIVAGGRRWVLYGGRWSEVGGQGEQGQEHRPLPA